MTPVTPTPGEGRYDLDLRWARSRRRTSFSIPSRISSAASPSPAAAFAACPTARCHYCDQMMVAAGAPEGVQRPHLIATKDHTVPKCDGGEEWVVACAQCNQMKGSDPYDVFMAFMKHGGRGFHIHERKAKYRWFRDQIFQIGLAVFEMEASRMSAAADLARAPEPANV